MTWQIAIDLIEEVHGTIAMYMFILEEACQTAGMACYLYKEAEMPDKAAEVANWVINNIIDPAIDFADTYGNLAYPLQISYKLFYQSARKAMEAYINTG